MSAKATSRWGISIMTLSALLFLTLSACRSETETESAARSESEQKETATMAPESSDKIELSEAEWRARLTPEQYRVLREKGTERAGTGEYVDEKTKGTYTCAGCGNKLFDSETKFKSGTGWPSFWSALKNSVGEIRDTTHGMIRTEVVCAKCKGHLGHVFDDGPEPSGMRYCINSISLKLEAEKQ